MPVACFSGRGKVHGSLAAAGTTVDSDPLWVVVVHEGTIPKVCKGYKKSNSFCCWTFLIWYEDLNDQMQHPGGVLLATA